MRIDFHNVLVEQDESVVTLTMNRPDVLNAINTLMLEELIELFAAGSVSSLANSRAKAREVGTTGNEADCADAT